MAPQVSSAPFGDASLAAYEAALARWRTRGVEASPLVGARLLRKMLVILTRFPGSVSTRRADAEMEALRVEARQLAESAGDADERWRVRVVDLLWPFWLGSITPEDAVEGRLLGQEVAAYFEARGQWEAVSEALDDPNLIQASIRTLDLTFALMLLNDRDVQCSTATLHAAQEFVVRHPMSTLVHTLAIAQALAQENGTALRDAIDEAEAAGLIPHAARMRIILAQRTGDQSHLDRARPVLNRLGDRQFLRRLEEVASALG